MNLQGKMVIYHCEDNEKQLNNGNSKAPALVLTDWSAGHDGVEGTAVNLRIFFDNFEMMLPESYKTSVPHGSNPGDWSLMEEAN